MLRHLKLILFAGFALLCANGFSQQLQFQFSRLDISAGLSNNQVNSIIKDKRGFMWFGTMSGLNCFDGDKFRTYRHDSRDSSSLIDDCILKIFQGPDGRLWVETRSGINIFNSLTETFERSPARFLNSVGIIDSVVTAVSKDSLGGYWLLMAQQKLFYYHASQKKAKLILQAAPRGALIDAVAGTLHGDLWLVFSDGQLSRIDARSKKIEFGSDALTKLKPVPSPTYSLFADSDGDLWIYDARDPKGVFHFQPASGSLVHISKENPRCRLNTNIVVSVVQDNSGRIWLCTDHGGVNIIRKSDYQVTYVVNNVDDSKSISQNSINSCYRDNEGIIWIGTFKKGISYYHEDIMQFPLYRHQPSNPNSLAYDDVNKFAEDDKGNLWIGCNGGGLIYYDRSTGKFTQYLHDPANPNSISNNVVVSLCIDHRKRLWIGTFFGGLDCFDGKTFKHYRNDARDSNSLSDNRVWEIFEDSRQNLWVGTLDGGLDRKDNDKDIFYHYKLKNGVPDPIHANYIASLVEDRSGNLWVGTANGIDVLDVNTGKTRYYSVTSPGSKSISNNNINSLFEDSRGLVWAGTRDGLNVYDPRTDEFRIFRRGDGLPSNTVVNILEDEKKRIWISTANGVSCITVKGTPGSDLSMSCTNYDELDGLQGTEFNENAALRTKKGELIFGGANGFNLFYPGNIKPDNRFSPVAITALTIFNEPVGIGEEINSRVILKQSVTETQSLTLKYNENVFTVEFAALNFSNPGKTKYAYLLDGFNKEWLLTDGNMRKATYTNLDPGSYVFRVKATNDQGVFDGRYSSLQVTILPPFWKTPMAYIIYVLLFVGITMLARHFTVQRAHMRFELVQQKEEAERMQQLDMMKTKFFTNVSHEFRTPLSLILTPLDKIVQDSEEPQQKKQFQLIQRNARRLLNLVNQLLDFRKLEVQELKVNPTQDDIIHFVKEISQSFTDIAEKRHIGFSFTSSVPSLYTAFDADKMERILFNLLSNAFKFTPGDGHVSVRMSAVSQDDKASVIIRVEDTGIGIPKEKQQLIFERFFQHDIPGSMVNQGSGIGLAITKEFVKLHGGSISVESEPGKGSCFSVTFPIQVLQEAPESTLSPDILPEPAHALPTGLQHQLQIAEAGRAKKPVLLLVEDNEDFRFYLKDNLREDFNIIEAEDGKEGWQKALAAHPDIIVSDISMPEMSGIDLCRKVKNDNRTSHMPVILLTALSGQEQLLQGLETGANDYMTKPFNFEILQSRIKNILGEQSRVRKAFKKQVDVKPADISMASPDEQFIYNALELVEKNLDQPAFSVEDLSRGMCMSRVALYKKLLSITGKTPIEFIRSIRLQRAAQLMEKSQFTVSEIAYEVGFNNPKIFSRYFKSEYNLLPSEYIRKMRI